MPLTPAPQYNAPSWLPGGHVQTIWAARISRPRLGPPLQFRRERWTTPDSDFIDTDWLDAPPGSPPNAPTLVLFHGLEGSRDSHSSQAFADWAQRQGWRLALPHFRGCSGEINLAPRAYHSGDFAEVGWMLDQVRARHAGPMLAVGISLGGNALLRWAEEAGDSAREVVSAVASVCSPIDLAAGGYALGRGFNRHVYGRMFLHTMVPRALQKWEQYPGLFDRDALLAARTLYAFDQVFTAPLHGFASTEDYWARASAKPHLARIRLPALVLNARNDPFVPAYSLPSQAEVGAHVTLWQPEQGGHVGFPGGSLPPGHLHWLPEQVMGWLRQAL